MNRIGFVLIGFVFLVGCNNHTNDELEENGFSYKKFSALFPPVQSSYEITDADLLGNKDTTVIRSSKFAALIPDSIKTKLFGKNSRVKYIALAQLKASKNTNYYVVKAISGSKRAALLLPFTNDQLQAAFPFLVPDNDGSTTQQSSIDKSNAITKSVSQKKKNGDVAEGRNVYQYIPEAKQFSLVLTNPLNPHQEIINPIDTLPRKNKFSGDYNKDKKNIVSIRDGRSSKEYMVFMHIEDGDCSGEIKGTILLTSSTTAAYRQGGDPCSVNFQFSSNSVTVKEEGGCGSRRGLDCSFDGTYKRKKAVKTKTLKKRSSSK